MYCFPWRTFDSRGALAPIAFAVVTAMAGAPLSAEQIAEQPASGLEEVIVTAERRAESIQSMPIAISAFSTEELAGKGIEDVGGLQLLAPSVQVGSPFGGFAQVNIRGIGSSFFGLAAEAAAAVSQDGVGFVSMQMFNAAFFDVDRVEVLRGPQGTLGGRLATAGAINVHSKRPTEEFEGSLKATVGNRERRAMEGHLSGPLGSDRLLGRLAVRHEQADGWLTNTLRGEDIDAVDVMQARASILARPTDACEALLILDAVRDRSNSIFLVNAGRARPDAPTVEELFGVPGFDRDSRTVAFDEDTRMDQEKYQATLNLGWELGDSAKLTAVSGYASLRRTQIFDGDGTQIAAGVTADSPRPTFDLWQASQDVTFTADINERLDVLLGATYLRYEGVQYSLGGRPVLGVPLGGMETLQDISLDSWAAYTQWRYRVTDHVRLTAGARYTEDKKAYAETRRTPATVTSGSDEHSWQVWTPRVSIDYTPTDELTLYTTVSRGYKPGGYNGVADRFNPENVWNYEAGVKAGWLDRRLRTALTGFYMDNTNLQQLVSGLDPIDPLRSRTINANSATIKGVELEVEALLIEGLRITASATRLSAYYDELITRDPLYPELGLRDLSGNRVVRAPQWQANLAGEYRAPLANGWEGVLTASYAWQDRIYFDFYNNPALSQGSYGLTNASAGIESDDGQWQLSAFVHNLTDEQYSTRMQVFNLLTSRTVQDLPASAPRTYGLSLAYRF